MNAWAHKQKAFTIVELLIVIVVIAILAAITVVAYTGIQGRANDAAVQSDLANAAKALELYNTTKSVYPRNDTELATVDPAIKVTKSAYQTGSTYNLTYCLSASNDGSLYGIVALSTSGKVYYVSSNSGGVKELGSWGTSVTINCPAIGLAPNGLWWYRGNTQTWASWL